MMGIKERSFQPLVDVSLESLVPPEHFYRHLDRSLDLSFVRDLVKDCYSPIGRPSIDPVVFFRLQLCMFFEGIRSERQLIRMAADRLSIRWYLGYDFCEPLPDHSSLTRIRERYGLDIFCRFFEMVVKQCIDAGLVWGRELYFDATKVEANAALDSMAPRFAVETHLSELFPEGATAGEAAPGSELLRADLSEDLLAELTEENAERHDWLAEEGRQNRAETRGEYRRLSDFRASRTDPDASVMQTKDGPHPGYQVHYAVDGGKARIILQTLVTPGEVTENLPMLDLLWKCRFRWKLHPHQVTGDTAYGTTEIIRAVEDQGIRAYTPLPDFDSRTPYYGSSRFTYDADLDAYHCPEGQLLRRRTAKYTEGVVVYQAEASSCITCPSRAQCTGSPNGRQVRRSFHEEYLDRVRGYHQTEAYNKAMRKRAVWVEPLFGEGKQWHGLGRFRLRRLRRVNIEAQLVATGQNLKRLMSWRGWGQRHSPGGAAGVAIAPSHSPLSPP